VVLSPVLPGNNSNNDNNSMLKSPANTASTTTFQLPVPSRTNNQF
jgi:hypothetical protein